MESYEMVENKTTIWGIHAGNTGQADTLFLKKNYIAIGWNEMGDLGKIAANRESFKTKVKERYADEKPGAIPNFAGQLFRFVHEMKLRDLVVYPSKRDRQIHLGHVTGTYIYDPDVDSHYPHLRRVEWYHSLLRTHFTQGALYEIGSAITLFQVKNYAEEFRDALEGNVSLPSVSEDETVVRVAEDIEQTTRDFVLKRLAQEFKGHPLAHFIAHLLGTMGYRTRISSAGPDSGVDIIAHRDELVFQPPIIKVQVKSTESSVGDPEVSSLYGKVMPGEYGLFVTLGLFTSKAKIFAAGKSNLRLVDGNELVDLVLVHYDEFDSRYKGLLPLKRMYVPDPEQPEE